jgi:SAM-dependent methyltransferase
MTATDLAAVQTNRWAAELRKLSREYRRQGLPVMNGAFHYSNLLEGDAQILTCNPYRLWEYSSLFLRLEPGARFLDVGGAASALPYLLAENGWRGVSVDLQPLLVAICRHAAGVRRLPLESRVADITADFVDGEAFDVVTFVSVLEHIAPENRATVFGSLSRVLKPGGLLYLTFDYGTYVERDAYRSAERVPEHLSASVSDLEALCGTIEEHGFVFESNDPRALPADLLALRTAPAVRSVMWRYALNTPPFDADTPWKDVLKYVAKRMVRRRNIASRFHDHNFFRMFLRKAS